MSLVVLRSWSDGQPPKIRGIAPPDSDDKNEIVVPDHNGRFVTEELPKTSLNTNTPNKVGVLRENFVKLNKPMDYHHPNFPNQNHYQNLRVGKFWNRKSLQSPNSLSSASSSLSLSPSPTNQNRDRERDLDKDGVSGQHIEQPDKIDLSRESSLQSLQSQSTDPDSAPPSPVGGGSNGNSRYKSLGPELAATIPKRQIIRDTWVRDSYSIFRKKELSKSNPTLNLSIEEDDLEKVDSRDSQLLQETERSNRNSSRRSSNTLSSSQSFVGNNSHGSRKSPLTRPHSSYFADHNPDKSWQDSVYGAEFEPKFGDKPASVVGVFKKDEKDREILESPKPKSEVPEIDPEVGELTREYSAPARPNSFYSTSSQIENCPHPHPAVNSNSSSDSGGYDVSNADLKRVKRIAKKAIRSVSFELDSHFKNKGKEFSASGHESEFPVHHAVYPSDLIETETPESENLTEIEIKCCNEFAPSTEIPIPIPDLPTAKEIGIVVSEISPKVTTTPTVIDPDEDEDFKNDDRIDLELDALRGESTSSSSSSISSSVRESERENIASEIFSEQQKQDFELNSSDQDEKIASATTVFKQEENNTMHLNLKQKIFIDPSSERRDVSVSNRNSHGHGNKLGSAWAQVPVQCINRHVLFPTKSPTIPPPVKPTNLNEQQLKQQQMQILTNGNGNGDSDSSDYGNEKNNFRRKNFCDELLSNVVLQVPVPPTPQSASLLTMESSPIIQENHDGIIIFDEEDEFEESETDSIALSERENSFEYLSVFQNVKVGTPTENKTRPTEPANIIGLDFGSTFSRFCSLDKSTNAVQIGDSFRTIVTSDGLTQGMKAISHSMATKSKLLYKWRARQTFPYDPYDDEDNSSILEVLFKHYNDFLTEKLRLRLQSPGLNVDDANGYNKTDGDAESSSSVQWNVSVHSSMEKKVVREAAFSSGLVKSTDELRLVNESTAAAVMAYQLLKAKNTSSHNHRKGDKTFLSVNIGSTYFHTSGYQHSADGKLQMVENGDSQTFQSPELQFIELLSRVFSREFLLIYESRFTPSWVEILIRFEQMKDNYIKFDSECYLFLPISFFGEFFKCTGIQVPECIEDNLEEGIVWDNNGTIRFKKDLMDDWLEPTLNFIKARIKIKSYDSIVLSGGGANKTLRKELEQFVPASVQVYLIDNPETAVVQGLVHLDSVHLSVKSPFSIGVGVMTPFDPKIHPEEKCVTRSGKKWCSDVWDNLIRKGQEMTMGEVVLKRTYVGAQPGQNVLILPIFKSELEEPKLVTSPYVEKCCELRFEINKEKSWREVQLVIKCCDRELSIIATGNDGDVSHVVIDF